MPTVLITGASGGLGRALVRTFAEFDWAIIAHSNRNEPPIVDQIVRHVRGDLAFRATAAELVTAAADYGVDALINCAGMRVGKSFDAIDVDSIVRTIETNVMAPLVLTHLIWTFLKQSGGVVINIGSLSATSPGPGEIAYAASKAALAGFSAALQFDATRDGVRVIHASLGAMQTEMTKDRASYDKMMSPAEVAREIFMLTVEKRDSLRVTNVTICRNQY